MCFSFYLSIFIPKTLEQKSTITQEILMVNKQQKCNKLRKKSNKGELIWKERTHCHYCYLKQFFKNCFLYHNRAEQLENSFI